MIEPHYCPLCECFCVACAQLEDGCDSCELKHPDPNADQEEVFSDG